MIVPWYNNPVEISAKLTNLKGLSDVIAARRNHGGTLMDDLVLLGRVFSDSHGNFHALEKDLLPANILKAVPQVWLWQEFENLVRVKGNVPENGGWFRSSVRAHDSYQLPTQTRLCPLCGQGWTIDNCEDVHADMDTWHVPLAPYVGMTMEAAGKIIADLPEAHCQFGFGPPRGTICISPVGHPSHDSLYRTEGSAIIGPSIEASREWEAKLRYVDLSHVVQPDDGSAGVFRYRSYHGACYEKLKLQQANAKIEELRKGLLQMLDDAGFTDITVERGIVPRYILEQFCGEEELQRVSDTQIREIPYFAVTTKEGPCSIFAGPDEMPYLDLRATGLQLTDFESIPDGCDGAAMRMVPLDPEGKLLLKLRKKLRGKRKS